MLRLLVLICLLNYSLCIEPTPCKCECPIYAIDLKIAKDNPCNKPCCSDKRTKFFDSVTARGCGQRNEDPYTVKIKGKNTTADYAEFPWTIGIFKADTILNRTYDVIQCAGSLIHPSVILTAAHCIYDKDKKSLKIRAGVHDLQAEAEPFATQNIQVKDYLIHDDYYRGGQFNDIALLFLTKPVKIAPNVNTICLPPQDQNFDLQRCYVAGWGKNSTDGDYQKVLKRVELPIIPRNKCETEMRKTRLGEFFNLHKSFICAGAEGGEDTCEGDGGAPLVCRMPNSKANTNTYFQAGIVSWGIGCGDKIPGIYVNVPLFRDWIDEQLQKNGYST